MKILFINPPYTNFEGIRESAGHMMPLCFGYLAAYARQRMRGLEFRILDTEALGFDYAAIEAAIGREEPDVVGITTPTPSFRHVVKISSMTKALFPRALVVLGGIHPTVLPQRTLQECPSADMAIMGEAENSFSEVLKVLAAGGRDFSSIPGVCSRLGASLILTERGPLLEDLDSLPFPARDLYDLALYRSAVTKKVSDDNSTPILTSRGCSYDCIHCPSRTIWGGRLRFRGRLNVVDEMEECVNKFNLREFNFFDDTFTLNRQRVDGICAEIISRGMKVSWICFSRVNTLDDDLVRAMKEAGCRKISFGLESGDQRILDLMRKRTTVEQGRRAVDLVRRHGLLVHASFMLGNVGETEESIRRTIDFATSLDLDNATFFITSPFPGTDLYKVASSLGSINQDTRWEHFAPLTNTSPVLVQESLDGPSLVRWQKRAFRAFYLRPAYIGKKMRLLASKEGIRMLAEGVRILIRILRK